MPHSNPESRQRNLTDADVEAIVIRFQERVTKQFYLDVGKGVWKMAWVAMIGLIITLAALGHLGGGK